MAIHEEQIAEHGGLAGLRDRAVQAALARPQNLAVYGDPDVTDLAAAYCYGLAKNHGFSDGNKRTAFVVAYIFLNDNGFDLTASDAEAVSVIRWFPIEPVITVIITLAGIAANWKRS